MSGRTTGHSRRTVLGRGAAAIGGLLGLGAAGATAVSAGGGAPSAGVGSGSLRLRGRNWILQTPNRKAGQRLVAGDQGTVHGDLVDDDGNVIGKFYGTRVAMQSNLGGAVSADGSMELHTFRLEGGTLLGQGMTVNGESVFAITAGTGRFAGRRGTYIARQNLRELGGDGSAEFTIDLS